MKEQSCTVVIYVLNNATASCVNFSAVSAV